METQKEYLERKIVECEEKACTFWKTLAETNEDGTLKNPSNMHLVLFFKNAAKGFELRMQK